MNSGGIEQWAFNKSTCEKMLTQQDWYDSQNAVQVQLGQYYSK